MKGEILHTARTFDNPGEIGYIFDPVREIWLIAWQFGRFGGLCFEIGEAENEIEDVAAVQSVMYDFETIIIKGIKMRDYFQSLTGPPSAALLPSPKDGGPAPLCKFGPGGRYTTDYTPRISRIAPRRVRAWLTRTFARLRAVIDKGQRG